jgi:F-type H+-transporting ATPase subunit gamma
MASLKDLRRRIGSVTNTRKITRAMKLVAAARLRRAQEATVRMRPYAYRIGDMCAELSRGQDSTAHPLLATRTPRKTLLLVLTSDRGLAGAFNANVCKEAQRWIEANRKDRDEVVLHIVGKKGRDYFKRRDLAPIAKIHTDVIPDVTLAKASHIGRELVAAYLDGSFDEVLVVYNEFKSAIMQNPRVEKLLPIVPLDHDINNEVIAAPSSVALFEPNRSEVLDSILPQHVNVQIFRALLESVANSSTS